MTSVRLVLSHSRKHKLYHGLQDTLNLLCSCGNDVVSTEIFFLYCSQFFNERHTILSTLANFNNSLLENTSKLLAQTLLFGSTSLSPNDHCKNLNAKIDFI